MATYSPFSANQISDDSQIWHNLKMAIASSSGFQTWQLEREQVDDTYQDSSLDYRVSRYLRETLETLAY